MQAERSNSELGSKQHLAAAFALLILARQLSIAIFIIAASGIAAAYILSIRGKGVAAKATRRKVQMWRLFYQETTICANAANVVEHLAY